MGTLSFLYGFLLPNIGVKSAAGSTAGTLNARLAALLPYVNGTTGTVLTYPSSVAAPSASAPNNTWGTTSTYTTVISSGTLSSHMLTGYFTASSSGSPTGTRFLVDIASGAAAAEVIQFSARAGNQFPNSFAVFPPIQWPVNERVSFRVSGGSTAIPVTLVTTFAKRPA